MRRNICICVNSGQIIFTDEVKSYSFIHVTQQMVMNKHDPLRVTYN